MLGDRKSSEKNSFGGGAPFALNHQHLHHHLRHVLSSFGSQLAIQASAIVQTTATRQREVGVKNGEALQQDQRATTTTTTSVFLRQFLFFKKHTHAHSEKDKRPNATFLTSNNNNMANI